MSQILPCSRCQSIVRAQLHEILGYTEHYLQNILCGFRNLTQTKIFLKDRVIKYKKKYKKIKIKRVMSN